MSLESWLNIKNQIELFGGLHGIKDERLLESALYTPKATFGNKYLLEDIFKMSAAYLFGVIKNHPFIDGNKRTGLASTFLFLKINGENINFKKGDLFDLCIDVANSEKTLDEISDFFRKK